jgi:pyridoxal phosphate enzyme (YggS family)
MTDDMHDPRTVLAQRLADVGQRLAAACRRAGRQRADVTVVAVTKTVSADSIKVAIEAGLANLGENRVQEAAAKIAELTPISAERNVKWHLIGHLQSNKARRAVELFDAIHSVDGIKLAERLNQAASEMGKRLPIFIEVNLGGEESKSGIDPGEAFSLCKRAAQLPFLELRGLMAVPPFLDDPQEVRPFFRRLRELREEIYQSGEVGAQFKELSMGMSNDFEVAIEEGATFVRVGTALFGKRQV